MWDCEQSAHWRASERIHGGLIIRSFDLTRVLVQARRPTRWERFLTALRRVVLHVVETRVLWLGGGRVR